MARKNRHDIKNDKDFGERLKEAFDDKPNTEIARELGVSDSAVTLYVKGRIPSATTLIEISNLTRCNLHWLLTGVGEKKIESPKTKTQTLVFQGGKGGVGTTAAAMLSAVVLAAKGHRTLLISSRDNIFISLFSLDKEEKLPFPPRDTTITESDIYTSTSIENLEIFTGKGQEFFTHFDDRIVSLEKSTDQIKKDYDFIIFDIRRFGDSLSKEDLVLKSFLSEGKLVIPYEISNSTIGTLDHILGSFNLTSLLFSSSFLGVFIHKEPAKTISKSKLHKPKLAGLQEVVGDKMFKTVIRENLEALDDFAINSDLEKLKKTQLFKDFSDLIDEILERLKKL